MSTPRSPFASVARPAPLDQQDLQGSRWLGDGTHDVVVEDLDSSNTEQTGKVGLVLRVPGSGSHKEGIYVLAQDGVAFGWQFRLLLGALLQSADSQRQFRELLAGASWRRVLESFRGMHLRVRLESKPGYRLVPADDYKYAAVLNTGESVSLAANATEAERRAKALGHKKSFRCLVNAEALDAETTAINIQAFDHAAASIAATTPPSDPSDSNFDGYNGAPPSE